MKKLLAAAMVPCCLGLGFVACAGKQTPAYTEESARQEVQQLITLYKEARAKFVVQKQQIIQAESCARATALREAIDKMAAEAAMNPENTETITIVQMELQQAEQGCLDK